MLTDVKTLEELAALLALDLKRQIFYYAYVRKQEKSYRKFFLNKKSGGTRNICAPEDGLMYVQKKIANAIYDACSDKLSRFVYSFRRGLSIKDFAKFHIDKKVIIKLDISDFYGSINFGRVLGMFMAAPFNLPYNVSVVLAQLCCFEDGLPQGAPSSPIISNIIGYSLDKNLSIFAKDRGFQYTRYADDMVFSARTTRRIGDFCGRDLVSSVFVPTDEISKLVSDCGFSLNVGKTRVLLRESKQLITGLVCNQKINVDRNYVRRILTLINLMKKNPDSALQAYNEWRKNGSVNDIYSAIRGMVNYVRHVKGAEDQVYCNLARRFNKAAPEGYHVPLPASKIVLSDGDVEKAILVIRSCYEEYGTPIPVDCDDDTESRHIFFKTGTCFFLHGIGLVTSFHCLLEKATVFMCKNIHFTYDYRDVIAADPALDIAILDPVSYPLGMRKEFPCGSGAEIPIGTPVKLYGFPHYQEGDGLCCEPTQVSQKKIYNGQTQYLVSGGIRQGQSGGPVVNDNGEVVGVIRSNGDDMHMFVPISDVISIAAKARGKIHMKSFSRFFTPFE